MVQLIYSTICYQPFFPDRPNFQALPVLPKYRYLVSKRLNYFPESVRLSSHPHRIIL
jgi:hypothetical protein